MYEDFYSAEGFMAFENDNALAHSGYFDADSNYLQHYGILGMHWGVRKQKESSGSTKRRKKTSDNYQSAASIAKKVGAGVGAAATVAGAAYAVKSGKAGALVKNRKAIARGLSNSNLGYSARQTGNNIKLTGSSAYKNARGLVRNVGGNAAESVSRTAKRTATRVGMQGANTVERIGTSTHNARKAAGKKISSAKESASIRRASSKLSKAEARTGVKRPTGMAGYDKANKYTMGAYTAQGSKNSIRNLQRQSKASETTRNFNSKGGASGFKSQSISSKIREAGGTTKSTAAKRTKKSSKKSSISSAQKARDKATLNAVRQRAKMNGTLNKSTAQRISAATPYAMTAAGVTGFTVGGVRGMKQYNERKKKKK